MKSVIKFLTVVAFFLGTVTFQSVSARVLDHHTTQEFEQKLAEKISETTKSITKDIGLDEKQSAKVYDIKLAEAKSIEAVRADKNIAPNETSNKILIIKNDANSKIEKLLSNDQKVLWNSKKTSYEYNPGFIENVKDKYNQTKENIQDRREEKKAE